MSKYIKATDGQIYHVESFEVVSADQLASEIAELENKLAELKALLSSDNSDQVTVTDEVTTTETETETITLTTEPTEPSAEQPQPEPAPTEAPAPVEPTAVPVTELAPVIQ